MAITTIDAHQRDTFQLIDQLSLVGFSGISWSAIGPLSFTFGAKRLPHEIRAREGSAHPADRRRIAVAHGGQAATSLAVHEA